MRRRSVTRHGTITKRRFSLADCFPNKSSFFVGLVQFLCYVALCEVCLFGALFSFSLWSTLLFPTDDCSTTINRDIQLQNPYNYHLLLFYSVMAQKATENKRIAAIKRFFKSLPYALISSLLLAIVAATLGIYRTYNDAGDE